MKYEGKRPSGKDKDVSVYTFSVGKEELEILTKLLQKTHETTPRVFELMPYIGRLRNLSKVFGEVWLSVNNKMLPTKKVHRTHRSLKNNI